MVIRDEQEFVVCVAAWFGLYHKADPTPEELTEIAELEAVIDEYERQHHLPPREGHS